MQKFSVVVSEMGWSAKCLSTGKELIGIIDDLPDDAYHDLISNVKMSNQSICTATEITIANNSPFSKWFRTMNKCLLVPAS